MPPPVLEEEKEDLVKSEYMFEDMDFADNNQEVDNIDQSCS